MASKSPVPSKAALNALRGLVFTTSCSVVLLAEERRRRTKVAKAAIENARKLHTLKARRQAMAMLGEKNHDLDLDSVVYHYASDSPRPRRRRKSPTKPAQGKAQGSCKHSEQQIKRSRVNEHPSSAASAVEATKVGPSPRTLKVAIEKPVSALGCISDVYAPSNGAGAPRGKLGRIQGYNEWRTRLAKDLQTRIVDPKSLAVEAVKARAPKSIMGHLKRGHLRKFNYNVANALKYLACDAKTSHGVLCLDEPLYVLTGLLRELKCREIWELSEPGSSDFLVRLAAQVLEKVASLESPLSPNATSAHFEKTCVEILKAVARLNTSHLTRVLVAMLPLHNDLSHLLEPFITWSFDCGNYEILEELGVSLSTPSISDWLTGDILVSLLKNHWEARKDFDATEQCYDFLRDAGVFELNESIRKHRQRIDNFMADIASQPQHMGQTKTHDKHGPEPVMSEILKQGEVLIRNIYSDLSSSIKDDLAQIDQIADLRRMPENIGTSHDTSLEKDFQIVLHKLTNVYMCKYSKSDLEGIISHFVQTYQMQLNHWWVLSVVRHHSRHLDLDSMVSWLQFCFKSGLAADNVFAQKLFWILSRFWSFPDREIVKIYDYLGQHVTDLQWPYWIKKSTSFHPTSNRASDRDYRQWHEIYLAFSKKLKKPSDGSDVHPFSTMYQAVQKEAWDDAWSTFEDACNHDMAFSERCTRLAIYARLQLDEGSTKTASELVWKFRGQGHDMSEVMAPLFLAYLEESTDPEFVIFKAIREGYRVPDNVFKTAARKAASQQNHRSVLKITQAAIGMNYGGDALANYQYFALLIGSYTAVGDYGRLTSLLDRLMSRKYWWAGSQTVTNRLKWSIRTLVRRSCNARLVHKRSDGVYQMVIEKLDDALIHCFGCKIFVDKREIVANEIIASFKDPLLPDDHQDDDGRWTDGSQAQSTMTQSPLVPRAIVGKTNMDETTVSDYSFLPQRPTEENDTVSPLITVRKTKQAGWRGNLPQHPAKNKSSELQQGSSFPDFPQLRSIESDQMQEWISDWVASQGGKMAIQPESCAVTSQILNSARQFVREASNP